MTPGVWVLRERRLRRVHPRSLVVGDLVVLVAGDRALADLRILIARSAEAESEELSASPAAPPGVQGQRHSRLITLDPLALPPQPACLA